MKTPAELQMEISRKGADACSIPVTVGDRDYPSYTAAAKALGVSKYIVARYAARDQLHLLVDPQWRARHFKPKPKPPPPPANLDYDDDGNLTPDAYAERLADFRGRRRAMRDAPDE